MSSYPDTLKVTRPGSGAMGGDDTFTPGSASTIYDDEADVQDEATEVRRNRSGDPEAERRAVAYLKDETKLDLIEVDDDAQVTFADTSVRHGKVVGARKLDGKVLIKWAA